MTQEEIWKSGSIFKACLPIVEYDGKLCVFIGWDDKEDNHDDDYDFRFPTMRFSDGHIESNWLGNCYEFVSKRHAFHCVSLL